MLSKPVIGINADFRASQNGKPAFSYLTAAYYDCIVRAGGVPVIIPPMAEKDDLNSLLDRVDAVLLVGGSDLDPRMDGFMKHPTCRLMERRREVFDRMLAQLVVDRKMPVFGIGVGMQLLNVVTGGNLFLHIPEDLPNAIPHVDQQDIGHRHTLNIEPDFSGFPCLWGRRNSCEQPSPYGRRRIGK